MSPNDFVYIVCALGPMTDPCGTPWLNGTGSDFTSLIYISKLCQDRLYTLYCFEKFALLSTSHIVVLANVIMISLPTVLFSSQDVSNMYSSEPNCTVSKIF